MNASQVARSVAPALLLVAALSACHGGRAQRQRIQSSPAPIPTAVAKTTSVAPSLTIAGIIAPLQNVAISTSLSEPTLSVNVNEGDRVTKGEVLATLDTTDLQANLEAQLALVQSDEARIAQARYQADLQYGQNPDSVRQARQSLKSAQDTLRQARQDLSRDRALVTQGYLAEQAYDQQATLVNTDTANVRSAQAALDSQITNANVNGQPGRGLQAANVASTISDAASARAQVDQIRSQIARATIVSPVDGVVVNRNLNPGEYPGSRTSFTVQELSSVYAELNASSADVFRIKQGSPVDLVAGSDASGRTYRGTIVAVLGQVAPGSTNFTVKALVKNADSTLQAGVPVTGTIALGTTRGVGIPSAAFLDDTNSSVLAVKNGSAVSVKVHQVVTNGTTAIVAGLPVGTTIVATGQLGIAPGQKIADAGDGDTGSDAGAPGAGAPSPGAGESPAPGASPGGHRHRHRPGATADATPGP